jgi:chaperone BCS1
MGIVNAMKTGNMHIDMVLAMCIPLIIRYLMKTATNFEGILKKILKWFKGNPKGSVRKHTRFITSSRKTNPNSFARSSPMQTEDQNKFLLQAVTMYLHCQVRLNLRDAHVDLTDGVDAAGGSSRLANQTLSTIASVLKSYKLIKKPLHNEWHNLGEYGKSKAVVKLRIEQFSEKNKDKHTPNEGNSGDAQTGSGKETVQKYNFESTDGEAIDLFLKTAYNWYVETLRKREDHSRYLYELKSTGYKRFADPDTSRLQCRYKRYSLSNEKTFESLFFQQKSSLLELLKNFQGKSGKYGIKGYPHKLGLLLHGPPGTGKVCFPQLLAIVL